MYRGWHNTLGEKDTRVHSNYLKFSGAYSGCLLAILDIEQFILTF